MHESGQQPVDEHQPVPGASSERLLTRPIDQSRVLTHLPARSHLSDQPSYDLPGQPGHPAIADSGGSRQAPRHNLTLRRASHHHHHEQASG
jgi:hypothetical protein